MRLGRPTVAVILTEDERVQLESWAHRSRTAPRRSWRGGRGSCAIVSTGCWMSPDRGPRGR